MKPVEKDGRGGSYDWTDVYIMHIILTHMYYAIYMGMAQLSLIRACGNRAAPRLLRSCSFFVWLCMHGVRRKIIFFPDYVTILVV